MITELLPLLGPFSRQSAMLIGGEQLAHFYSDVDRLTDHVVTFLLPAFLCKQGAMITARPQTRREILRKLKEAGVDVDGAIARGQLILQDAETLLQAFVRNDHPDAQSFDRSVSPAVAHLKEAYSNVRAYGEMVDVLWQRGNTAGAMKLAWLANQISEKHTFITFRGYRFEDCDKNSASFNGVCCSHTHIVTEDGNLRLVSAV